jgi:hypothetical protein
MRKLSTHEERELKEIIEHLTLAPQVSADTRQRAIKYLRLFTEKRGRGRPKAEDYEKFASDISRTAAVQHARFIDGRSFDDALAHAANTGVVQIDAYKKAFREFRAYDKAMRSLTQDQWKQASQEVAEMNRSADESEIESVVDCGVIDGVSRAVSEFVPIKTRFDAVFGTPKYKELLRVCARFAYWNALHKAYPKESRVQLREESTKLAYIHALGALAEENGEFNTLVSGE